MIQIAGSYWVPIPPTTLTNDSSVMSQGVTDADGIRNIDSQCTVKVADLEYLGSQTAYFYTTEE
jgi:hypothetical protein